jgi:hypothetical protein
MKISMAKILMLLLILVIIPAGCLLLSMKNGSDTISFDQISYSEVAVPLMVYYLLMTVAFVVFFIIRKIIAYLNQEK